MNREKTNPQLISLIQELRVLSNKENVKLWKRLAKDLGKSTRSYPSINVWKINKNIRENEIALIPGKVLSKEAREKINKKGKAITIKELIKEKPKGSKVRIIG